jgi:hypothetical protein
MTESGGRLTIGEYHAELKRLRTAIEDLRRAHEPTWMVDSVTCGVQTRGNDFYFGINSEVQDLSADELEGIAKYKRAFEQWLKNELPRLPPSTGDGQ